jgi:hypothetical protein
MVFRCDARNNTTDFEREKNYFESAAALEIGVSADVPE